MFGLERRHGERAGAIRIDQRRRAETVLPDQRAEAGEQRRQLLRRRLRAREERVLQHAAGRRIDDDGDAIDAGARRMRFEIEQRQRAQRSHVAHRRRQLEPPRADLARHQPQQDVQHRGAAVAPFEARRQRLEQPRQHERQRLELLDRPFEIHRGFEPFFGDVGDQRTRVLTARNGLPDEPALTEPRRHIGGWKRGNQQSVISASHHAGQRARCVTAQAIGYHPFAVEQHLRRNPAAIPLDPAYHRR